MAEDLLHRIVAHYRERCKAPRRFELPELADQETGEPARIYVWPITLDEMGKINSRKGTESIAMTLIVRARREDRSPFFAEAEIASLMNEGDAVLLGNLAKKINADITFGEDQEGASEASRPNA
ncbi:hypothetical protein FJ251_08815 [bacterium]|nr:hypothetical protein [bacterium]